jgi:hypothetical protein
MEGEDYKIKTGKYIGKMLKEIPASYLLYCYDNNCLWDRIALRFVVNNETELRNKIISELK